MSEKHDYPDNYSGTPPQVWPMLVGEVNAGVCPAMATLARLVDLKDLDAAMERLVRLDTVGPILDPTGWMRSHENAAKWREVIRTLRSFAQAVQAAAPPLPEGTDAGL